MTGSCLLNVWSDHKNSFKNNWRERKFITWLSIYEYTLGRDLLILPEFVKTNKQGQLKKRGEKAKGNSDRSDICMEGQSADIYQLDQCKKSRTVLYRKMRVGCMIDYDIFQIYLQVTF